MIPDSREKRYDGACEYILATVITFYADDNLFYVDLIIRDTRSGATDKILGSFPVVSPFKTDGVMNAIKLAKRAMLLVPRPPLVPHNLQSQSEIDEYLRMMKSGVKDKDE